MADSDSSFPSSDSNPKPPPTSLYTPRWFSRIAKDRFFTSVTYYDCDDYLHDIFNNYANGFIDTVEFELSVLKLIKHEPVTVEEFKILLSSANLIPSPKTSGNVVFVRRNPSFHEKVRAEMYDDTEKYMDWLKNLLKFKKGSKSFRKFKKRAEVLLADEKIEDKWKEFHAEFAPGDDDVKKLNQESSSAAMPSNTSGSAGQEPLNASGSAGPDPSNASGSAGQEPSNASGSAGPDPSNASGSAAGQEPSNASGSAGQEPSPKRSRTK